MDQTHTAYQNIGEADTPLIGQIPLPLPTPDTPAPSPPTDPNSDRKILTVTAEQEYAGEVDDTLYTRSSATDIFRILLEVFMGLMAFLAVVVYSITLLTEGGMVLSQGIGHIAAGELFGGMSMVSVQKINPPMETQTPALPAPSEPSAGTPLASLPANENESGSVTVTDIRRYDLSSRSPLGLGLINETPYSPDLETLLTRTPIPPLKELQKEYGTDAPVVLILHTHGTEAFSDSAAEGYHTADADKNITTIGALIAKILEQNGISTLHCTTLFDADSFDSAYYNASLYIKEVLFKYPSISYIFDIHRDAITNAANTGIAPYTEKDGIGYAQMMFVVGTDHGGSGHTGWLENLSLAVRLQASLYEKIPTLMRDINLRSASFNAQYEKGAMLIEVGAAASDIIDVENSARQLATAIAREILTPGGQTN